MADTKADTIKAASDAYKELAAQPEEAMRVAIRTFIDLSAQPTAEEAKNISAAVLDRLAALAQRQNIKVAVPTDVALTAAQELRHTVLTALRARLD